MRMSEEGRILSGIFVILSVILLAIVKITELMTIPWSVVMLPVIIGLLVMILATLINILKEIYFD